MDQGHRGSCEAQLKTLNSEDSRAASEGRAQWHGGDGEQVQILGRVCGHVAARISVTPVPSQGSEEGSATQPGSLWAVLRLPSPPGKEPCSQRCPLSAEDSSDHVTAAWKHSSAPHSLREGVQGSGSWPSPLHRPPTPSLLLLCWGREGALSDLQPRPAGWEVGRPGCSSLGDGAQSCSSAVIRGHVGIRAQCCQIFQFSFAKRSQKSGIL